MNLSRSISHPATPETIRGGAGFTLIEAILALGVCALVLVAVNAIFFSALRLRARTYASLDDTVPIERALNLLRRDLKNAVPPGVYLAGPLQSGVISGGIGASASENSSIQIFTSTGTLRADAPWGDIQKVWYQLQPPANPSTRGKDLVRSVTRNLLPTAAEDFEEQWLASGIEDLQFSYFDGVNWLDAWDALWQTNLPNAVRVSIYLANGTGTTRPEPLQLLVPLIAHGRTNAVVFDEEEENEAN